MSAVGVRSVLVLGGTSEIGIAICRSLVERGATRVVLAGRDPAGLALRAAAFHDVNVEVSLLDFDVVDAARHRIVIEQATDKVGDLDVIICAVGVLADEQGIDADPVAIARVVAVNMGGTMGVLAAAGSRLQHQGHGTLVVLSSVAGFLVRSDNPIYGASKAGLDAYACALDDLLRPSGASVLVVRPGFVRTAMTAGMADRPMATTADAVAAAVVKGMDHDAHVVWVPRAVGLVMNGLRLLPRSVLLPLFRRQAGAQAKSSAPLGN